MYSVFIRNVSELDYGNYAIAFHEWMVFESHQVSIINPKGTV